MTLLRRCPFCGGHAAEPDGNGHTWCTETSCGSDAYMSVEAWNRRDGAAVSTVPEGWQLVPKEPTVAMRMPWKSMRGDAWYDKYKAMLDAAPSAPQSALEIKLKREETLIKMGMIKR